jgi:hypothetical protein
MPTRDWISKKAVVSHQCGAPCPLIYCDQDKSAVALKQIPCQIEEL